MLLGVAPFGLICGVAMVASGIAPAMAVLMSLAVFAGASMIASAQLLASGAPLALVILATAFINLRFMMYSASLRPHFAHAPLGWRLAVGYLVADNVVGLSLGRFDDHPEDRAKLEFFLGVGLTIWLLWQAAVGAGGPATFRGHRLSDDDRARRFVITRVMCQGEVRAGEFEGAFGEAFARRFSRELEGLRGMARDGLVELAADGSLRVTATGRLLVRNVAMVFDAYLPAQERGERPIFSRTV